MDRYTAHNALVSAESLIQRHDRNRIAQEKLKSELPAATRIQATLRGHLVRKRLHCLRYGHDRTSGPCWRFARHITCLWCFATDPNLPSVLQETHNMHSVLLASLYWTSDLQSRESQKECPAARGKQAFVTWFWMPEHMQVKARLKATYKLAAKHALHCNAGVF